MQQDKLIKKLLKRKTNSRSNETPFSITYVVFTFLVYNFSRFFVSNKMCEPFNINRVGTLKKIINFK